MVRFYGLCDGKKNVIFLVFVWKCLFFSQSFWRELSNWEQLIVNYV